MTTLAASALNIAKQLGRVDSAGTTIVDLGDEIKEEIRNTIRHYNREPWHLTETREIQFDTIANQVWYDEGETGGVAAAGTGLTVAASNVIIVDTGLQVSFRDVVNIDYIRETSSSLQDGLREMKYREFERMFEGGALGGTPYGYTLYGGQMGIYPKPTATYTIQFSATVKAQVPVNDGDGSVWLDEAGEMIEASAAGRVCAKYLRDMERAQVFASIASPLVASLHREFVRKAATGRITPHC